MEFEDRNKKPEDSSKNLPLAVLLTLVGIVCLLLFVGWKMVSDDSSSSNELTHRETPVEESTIGINDGDANENFETTEESFPAIDIPVASTTTATSPTTTIEEPVVAEKPAISVSQSELITHTVAAKETFFSIATRYNLSQETLKSYNPDINPNKIAIGATKIKVPVMAVHTVGPGDILRVVAKKYNVTVKQLMLANNKKRNFSERGEKLIIPNRERR